jgi:hypothetical protein
MMLSNHGVDSDAHDAGARHAGLQAIFDLLDRPTTTKDSHNSSLPFRKHVNLSNTTFRTRKET